MNYTQFLSLQNKPDNLANKGRGSPLWFGEESELLEHVSSHFDAFDDLPSLTSLRQAHPSIRLFAVPLPPDDDFDSGAQRLFLIDEEAPHAVYSLKASSFAWEKFRADEIPYFEEAPSFEVFYNRLEEFNEDD